MYNAVRNTINAEMRNAKCEKRKEKRKKISSLSDDLTHSSLTFLWATGSPLVPQHP